MNRKNKGIMMLVVVAVLGLTTLLIAGCGFGWGHGPGRHHRGRNWHGQNGFNGSPTVNETTQPDQQYSAFFNATGDLRQKPYEKELAKENTDTHRASKLHSEISGLYSKLDQMQLDYKILDNKTAPNNSD